ncbi:anti-phage deoxyguanosine triphosphatase [Kerstersia similis]|uniref:anti-phage deoxyguanosine triphosphatase n=1 Tax=Kerstersia similis TaxID=206505 RepID=UPI0039EFA8F2
MLWQQRREPWEPVGTDVRTPYDVDYARIIHCASFRRLQGKTQILSPGDNDFYRTRLTHSLEVAQIAAGIVRQFECNPAYQEIHPHLPSLSMIQVAGATHDLGHPPFGHGGEVALNYCMRAAGGFEGNGQTLRIVSRLEKFSEHAGANLTRRAMLSLLKYPVPYSQVFNPDLAPRLETGPSTIRIIDRKVSRPPKCYLDSEQEVVDWILAPLNTADRERFTAFDPPIADQHGRARHKSFDCSIMDIADDIAFGVHDLEDALAMDLIEPEDFRRHAPWEKCVCFLESLRERYAAEMAGKTLPEIHDWLVDRLFGDGGRRKRFIGRLVHYFISHCRVHTDPDFEEPLLRYRASLPRDAMAFLDTLKTAVKETVILSAGVQQMEFKGQRLVIAVFEALASEPRAFLPRDVYQRWQAAPEGERLRVICDHMAGMTDAFLLKTYDRLFLPHVGSAFDRM